MRSIARELHPKGMAHVCSHTQRPLHTSIEGNRVKRGLAAGCLSFGLLLLGQARKSNLLSVNHRRGRPAKTGHKIQPCSDQIKSRPEEPTYKKIKEWVPALGPE